MPKPCVKHGFEVAVLLFCCERYRRGKCQSCLCVQQFWLSINTDCVLFIVVVVSEWGPVICTRIRIRLVRYFILLQILCYWVPRAPSSGLRGFPIRRAFCRIGFEFPALSVRAIWVHLVTVRTFRCCLAFFYPRLMLFCLRCPLREADATAVAANGAPAAAGVDLRADMSCAIALVLL